MKRSRLSFLVLAACLAAPTIQAVPTQLSADAGEVRDIKYASGSGASAIMYAATQGGGVFKSTNGGSTWAKTGLNTGYAWKIAISDVAPTTRVYAATDFGLYRSDNAGTSWLQLTFDPARAVAVDANSVTNDTLLLGVTGQGVFKSTDNGATFTRQSNGLDSVDVTEIVYQLGSSTVAYALLECNSVDTVAPGQRGNWGGVFRTTNANAGTVTWVNYNAGGGTPLPTKCVKAIAANASTIFAGTQDPLTTAGSIYRSTGAGWIGPGGANGPNEGNLFGLESLAIDRIAPTTTIHAGAHHIAFRTSTDGGVTWVQKVDPSPTEAPDAYTKIFAIESVPGAATTILIAARGIGIMRSTNYTSAPASAIAWSVAPGITADRVRGLDNHAVAFPNRFWMALEQGGVMRSDSAGAIGTWGTFNKGFDLMAPLGNADMLLSATAIAADPGNTGVAIVGTRGGGLFALSGGTTWDQSSGVPAGVRAGSLDFKPLSLLMPATNKVYLALFDAPGAGKSGGLLVSSSGPGGLTQTPYPDIITNCGNPPPGASSGAHKVVQTSSSVAYLLRLDGLPYRSNNNFTVNNATCINAPSIGFERLYFHDIAEQPNNTAIVVGATNKGIFRSTDSGANWARLTIAGIGAQVLQGLAYISNGILYGITRGGGFFCSSDNGNNWSSVSLGALPGVPFRSIKNLNGSIHILTDGGGVYTGFAATCP